MKKIFLSLFSTFLIFKCIGAEDPENIKKYAPASKFTVVVFSGHNGIGGNNGAKSSSGIYETEYNDILGAKLVSLSDDDITYVFVPASEKVALKKRPALAKRHNADIIIEIHHDSAQQEDIDKCIKKKERCIDISGVSVFFSSGSKMADRSEKAALLIGSNLKDSGFKQNFYHSRDIPGERKKLVSEKTAVYDAPFYILVNTAVPSVLIEAGVITNPLDDPKIKTGEYQDKFVKAVHKGVSQYFDEVSKSLGSIKHLGRIPHENICKLMI